MTESENNAIFKNANLLFLGLALLHVVVDGFFYGFNRKEMFGVFFWVYLLLAFIIAFFFLNSDNIGMNLKYLALFIGISLAVIYLPIVKEKIINFLPTIPQSAHIFINAVFWLMGLWPFYIWKTNSLSGKMLKFANFYVMSWLTLVIIVMFVNAGQAFSAPAEDAPPPMDVGEVMLYIKSNILDIFTAAGKAPAAIKESSAQAFNQSTGQQYYQGEVEKNANQKIGVYIENIKEADPYNYEDMPILLWATVKARSYEGSAKENTDIKIKTSCMADRFDPAKNIIGRTKRNEFTVESYDEEDIECTFPTIETKTGKKRSLLYGEHTITFAAKYNFITKAYKKAYFTDYDLLSSLNRENIDIFTQYSLEKSPKAIYTNGPIEIGIDTQEIIALRDDETRNPTVGFSLKNRNTGALTKINRIVLYLPKGIEIEQIADGTGIRSDCNKDFKQADSLSDDISNAYILENEVYKNNNKEDLQSFRCTLKVDKEKLMDNSPVMTRYFRIDAEYEYELYASRTITVRTASK